MICILNFLKRQIAQSNASSRLGDFISHGPHPIRHKLYKTPIDAIHILRQHTKYLSLIDSFDRAPTSTGTSFIAERSAFGPQAANY